MNCRLIPMRVALLLCSCAPCPDGTILPLWSLAPCPAGDTDEMPMADGGSEDAPEEPPELWDPCAPIGEEILAVESQGATLQPYVLASASDYSLPLTFDGPDGLGLLDRSLRWLPVAVLPGQPSYGWQWIGGAPAVGSTVAVDPAGLVGDEGGNVWRIELDPPSSLEQLAIAPDTFSYAVPWILVDESDDGLGYDAFMVDDDGALLFIDAGPWTLVAGEYPAPLESFALSPMVWWLGHSMVIGRASPYFPHAAAPWGADLEDLQDDGVGVIPIAGWCIWTHPAGEDGTG